MIAETATTTILANLTETSMRTASPSTNHGNETASQLSDKPILLRLKRTTTDAMRATTNDRGRSIGMRGGETRAETDSTIAET
jgi:hypothetical protein